MNRKRPYKNLSAWKSLTMIAIFFLIRPISIPAQQLPVITQEDLKHHVYHLASPDLEGRKTGKPGQKLAALYIDSIFREAGLIPLREGSYYQPFALYRSTMDKIIFSGRRGYVTALSMGGIKSQVPDSASFLFTGKKKVKIIEDGAKDQFIVVIPKSIRDLSKMVKYYSKADPSGYLIVMESKKIVRATSRKSRKMDALRLHRDPKRTKLDKIYPSDQAPVLSFTTPELCNKLFGLSTEQEYMKAGNNRTSSRIMISDPFLMKHIPGKLDSIVTENITGMIEGGKKKDEFIVVTAHYDHIGIDRRGINAGADDNASGTAALLELAKGMASLKASGYTSDRSIIFAAVSAEELGLFGSEYFVSSPEFIHLNGVLNINMDMIGKSIRYRMIETFRLQMEGSFVEDTTARESYVYLLKHGKGTRKLVHASKKSARQYEGFKVDQRPGFLVRVTYKHSSDHKSFHKKGIPMLVYFTGLHPDYHTPGDTMEKLDYENMTKVTNIIFHTLLRGANP